MPNPKGSFQGNYETEDYSFTDTTMISNDNNNKGYVASNAFTRSQARS